MAGLLRVRFLVVEDNAHMSSIVKTILRGFGAVHIREARDAVDAFDRLKTEEVDIVFVDYQMPVLNGIEFAQMVRTSTDSANRYVPIIMLTAYSERSHVEAARDAGINEFCCKPVTALEIYRKIQAVVDHARPFVKCASYFGPDRRRKVDGRYEGKERRANPPLPEPQSEIQVEAPRSGPKASSEANQESAA